MEKKQILIIGGIAAAAGAVVLLTLLAKAKRRKQQVQQQIQEQKRQEQEEKNINDGTLFGGIPNSIRTKEQLLDHYYMAWMKADTGEPTPSKYDEWTAWLGKIQNLSFDEIKLSYLCLNGIYTKDQAGNRLNLSQDPNLYRDCMNWSERNKIALE